MYKRVNGNGRVSWCTFGNMGYHLVSSRSFNISTDKTLLISPGNWFHCFLLHMAFHNIQFLENIEHDAAKPRPDRAEQRLHPRENREGHALFGLYNLGH